MSHGSSKVIQQLSLTTCLPQALAPVLALCGEEGGPDTVGEWRGGEGGALYVGGRGGGVRVYTLLRQ